MVVAFKMQDACQACPPGRWSNHVAANSSSLCTACTAGRLKLCLPKQLREKSSELKLLIGVIYKDRQSILNWHEFTIFYNHLHVPYILQFVHVFFPPISGFRFFTPQKVEWPSWKCGFLRLHRLRPWPAAWPWPEDPGFWSDIFGWQNYKHHHLGKSSLSLNELGIGSNIFLD